MSDQEEIDSLKKKLAAAEGKALAAARALAQAERDAKKAAESAQVYRDETDQMIDRSAEQMKQAFAIGLGIWSLARWAEELARNKHFALRMLHREVSMIKVLDDFVKGSKTSNRQVLESALRDAEAAVNIYKANTERIRAEEKAAFVVICRNETSEMITKVRSILDEG